MYKTIDNCRLCGSSKTDLIWDFGKSPLANAFKTKEDLDKPELEFPLRYFKCAECHSVQLKDEVDSDILFKEYLYESPPNLIPHFTELAKTTSEFLGLKQEDMVLDIGSNNGLLLKEFQKLGYVGYGVEPAAKIADKARDNGIPTFTEFFNKGFAQYLQAEQVYPKLITATNSFAHLSDLNDFVEGLSIVMQEDSYFVFENCYLLNTLDNKDLGQCYLEHFYLHGILSLEKLFRKYGFELFKIEYNKVQMGSIRGYVRKKQNQLLLMDDSVIDGVMLEAYKGLNHLKIYEEFMTHTKLVGQRLRIDLDIRKKQGESISVFAWPAKMTLINKFFGLEKYIDYVVEESPVKIGKFCPGTKLEIKSLEYFKQNPTKNCIIGAFNFQKDIKAKNKWYQGSWINPLSI